MRSTEGGPVLVAPDSFKGTFSAAEVAAAMAAGLARSGFDCDRCPLADGGEGTTEAVVTALGGEIRRVSVSDPLGRSVEGEFALLDDGQMAVVEMASASGLPLLDAEERDAEAASSRGTGELIAAAIDAGAERILVGAGGSATTDGGAGAIAALRERDPRHRVKLTVLSDTNLRYLDAAPIFAPQKGADAAAVRRLVARLERFADSLPRDPRPVPFSAAGGGLAGGLWGAERADLVLGAPFIFDLLDVARRVRRAGWVISGEGRLDRQSLTGKAIGSLAELCSASERGLAVIAGASELTAEEGRRHGIGTLRTAQTLAQIEATAATLSAPHPRTNAEPE